MQAVSCPQMNSRSNGVSSLRNVNVVIELCKIAEVLPCNILGGGAGGLRSTFVLSPEVRQLIFTRTGHNALRLKLSVAQVKARLI